MNIAKTIFDGITKSFNFKVIPKQEAKEEQEPVFITLKEAKRIPALVTEIFKQINNAKLAVGSSNNYVGGVKYKRDQYYILGTLREWESLFAKRDPVPNDGARVRAGVSR